MSRYPARISTPVFAIVFRMTEKRSRCRKVLGDTSVIFNPIVDTCVTGHVTFSPVTQKVDHEKRQPAHLDSYRISAFFAF